MIKLALLPFVTATVFLSAFIPLHAAEPASAAPHSAALQTIVDGAVAAAMEKFQKLLTNEIAVTLIDVSATGRTARASYRGDVQIYPASVVKLFYLAATHSWLQDGRLQDTEELRRALRDMIVDSGNEPTHYIVDLLTDTTSGPELPADELERWLQKRNAVNRHFAALGYRNINVNRKPWCEGPYGREMQSIKVHKPNHRNWLTTDATARLMAEIVTGKSVSAERCREMMQLLKRDPFGEEKDPDSQSKFTGPALPRGSKLWSKAGWTSETRHDCAYIETPDGLKFVLVTFTVNHANEREIIPTVAREVIRRMTETTSSAPHGPARRP